MMAKVIYLGELRTKAVHIKSGNSIQNDAPLDNHGKGQAFSPTDMLSTALATCMLTVMGIAAEERGWNIKDAEALVTKTMASNPRRVSRIQIELTIPERNLSTKDQKRLEAIALSCPVAKSLHEDLEQIVEFSYV